MPFGKKKNTSEKPPIPEGGPPMYPTTGGYPSQPTNQPQQFYNTQGQPAGPPPPYTDASAPPPYGYPQGGYGPPGQQGYGPPPQQGYGPPQQQGYGPSPQQGYRPPPQQGNGPPQQQGPSTTVVNGGFDAGARFDGVAQANIPPPPPGCAPNHAQRAMAEGHNVVVTQRQGNFWEGGSDGGYVMF